MQFARPEAVELLEKVQTDQSPKLPKLLLISTADPALPFGGVVDWDLYDLSSTKLTIVRAPSNHLLFINAKPVFYSENYASRLWQLANTEQESLDEVAGALKTWLMLPAHLRPRKRIEILQINDQPATESRLTECIVRNGFEREGEKLVLWPSGV